MTVKTKRYEINTKLFDLMTAALNEKDVKESINESIRKVFLQKLHLHTYQNGFLMHQINYKFTVGEHHTVYVYVDLEIAREHVSNKTFKVLKKFYEPTLLEVSIFSYGEQVFNAIVKKEEQR